MPAMSAISKVRSGPGRIAPRAAAPGLVGGGKPIVAYRHSASVSHRASSCAAFVIDDEQAGQRCRGNEWSLISFIQRMRQCSARPERS